MRKMKFYWLTICAISLLSEANGQGCSDAGFCTIDGFKPGAHADSSKTLNNQIKVGAFYGSADNNIAAYGAYLEYNRVLNHKLGVDIKLTSLGQSGNDVSVFDISDAFVNFNYQAGRKLKFTLGGKIPFNSANQTHDNRPLPMDYQSSLGTFDLIFGVGYQLNGFQFVAALQQPLTQNDNEFVSLNQPPGFPFSGFQTTNQFVRQGDVLLRVSYPLEVDEQFKLTPSLLPIYHLGKDKYTDALNVEREIEGSEGLTVNFNLYADYMLSEKSFLQLNVGFPMAVRDTRPDGLTRSFIANLEYRFRF